MWHRHWKPITSTPDQQQLQLVVPTGLRTAVLKACHDHILSGHLGFNKTYNKIKCRFWWPNLYTEVRNYVLGCIPCQRRKHPRINLKGVLQPHAVSYPWQRMSMDLLGPYPVLDRGIHIFWSAMKISPGGWKYLPLQTPECHILRRFC